MKFQIIFEKTAHKELNGFAPAVQLKLLTHISQFLTNAPYIPIKTRIKKLAHFKPPLYRLRMGELRIYYRIQEACVVNLAIMNRKKADHWLKHQ